MFPSVLSSASAAKNLIGYRSIFRKNLCTGYKSAYSLDRIYPNSSLKITSTPKPPESKEDVFSGYIPANELQITYSRSGGPGGQHVNKVNTKVDVRFHVATAKWLTESIKYKILQKYKTDISKDGFLIVRSEKTRMQMLNLADCMDKLRKLIREAIEPPYRKPFTEEERKIALAKQEKANAERLRVKRERSLTKHDRQAPTLN